MFFKHGLTVTNKRTYNKWFCMVERCHNPEYHNYKIYGGRGIEVCERWKDFVNFFNDMGPAPAGLTIERINNFANYEPGNCRWATAREQANNRRNNHLITYGGRTLTMAQWAEKTGLSSPTIRERLNNLGWSIERALTTPSRLEQP